MTALAWAVTFLVLAGCGAYAYSVRAGRVSVVVLARWAWRCRGRPPVRDEGGEKLTSEEVQVLGDLDAGRDVRSRT